MIAASVLALSSAVFAVTIPFFQQPAACNVVVLGSTNLQSKMEVLKHDVFALMNGVGKEVFRFNYQNVDMANRKKVLQQTTLQARIDKIHMVTSPGCGQCRIAFSTNNEYIKDFTLGRGERQSFGIESAKASNYLYEAKVECLPFVASTGCDLTVKGTGIVTSVGRAGIKN